MKLTIYTVDAFTSERFKGNPAAICILEEEIVDELMKKIAFELNLSETAFVQKQKNGYSLRWFTPAMEVNLCGHGTLATSHILWQTGLQEEGSEIKFFTKSGELIARKNGSSIELDFPVIEQKEITAPPELVKALGAKPSYVGSTDWNYIVEFDSEKTVRYLEPDFDLLRKLPAWGTIVTARGSSDGYDFISRFFAPEKGVPEDPVTGSAHCVLGPYWMNKLGKNTFKAYQASHRGGVVGVRVENDRVYITGNAITVIEGKISVLDK